MRFVLTVLLLLPFFSVYSQEKSLNAPAIGRYIETVNQKYTSLNQKIKGHTLKTLQQLRKKELKLVKKLARKDTSAAAQLRENITEYYDQLEARVLGDTNKSLKEYIAAFDTTKTSIAFIEHQLKKGDPLLPQLEAAKLNLRHFESNVQGSNELKRMLKERKQQLAARLGTYGMAKQLKQVSKGMYYYQQQINEYKGLVKDTKKLERKALSLLRDSEAFQRFMKKNSMLAQLFKLPDNYGTPESLAGLQTTAGVQATLNARFAGTGVSPQQQIQQQVSQAQAQMNKLKNKVAKLGGNSSSDIDMPENFRPNKQKTKSFMKRLEYGTTLQTQRLNSYFPVTTDIALSIGYKLNDKSVIGVGASYKLGWGSGIQNIKLSSEGVGLRSFIDWKAPFSSPKGGILAGLWITGGYEQNYYQRFGDFRQLANDINLWRQSALLGLTKKVKMGKKKESKVQLLYDFFYTKDNVRSQPVVFRVGYGF
jgi:Mg2+ and Co2+ transporter CorA